MALKEAGVEFSVTVCGCLHPESPEPGLELTLSFCFFKELFSKLVRLGYSSGSQGELQSSVFNLVKSHQQGFIIYKGRGFPGRGELSLFLL